MAPRCPTPSGNRLPKSPRRASRHRVPTRLISNRPRVPERLPKIFPHCEPLSCLTLLALQHLLAFLFYSEALMPDEPSLRFPPGLSSGGLYSTRFLRRVPAALHMHNRQGGCGPARKKKKEIKCEISSVDCGSDTASPRTVPAHSGPVSVSEGLPATTNCHVLAYQANILICDTRASPEHHQCHDRGSHLLPCIPGVRPI